MKLLITTQMVDQDSPLLGFFAGWLSEFARHFEEVHVICLKKGVYDLPGNVYVYSLGKEDGESLPKYILRFYKYFWHIFFGVKVEYVFFHMGAIYNIMAAPFFLIRKLYGTKFYWWKTHGQINMTGRIALLFVDRVYTAIAESFPVRTKKKHVVGHAIDVGLFAHSPKSIENKTILFVGRFSRSKRLEQVVEIVRALRAAGSKVTATFIGQLVDPEYFREIQAHVKELGVTEYVTFIEGLPHEQLVTEYQKAKLFVNPSDNDGLDKVVLEAMVSGTVPLTANRSFDSVLSKYDLFMQKGDIEGYVKAAERVFALSEVEYTALADRLRNEVVEHHSINTLSERIFGLL